MYHTFVNVEQEFSDTENDGIIYVEEEKNL